MKNYRRKNIDIFLIELEKFITENQLKDYNAVDLYMFIKAADIKKAVNSLWRNKDIISLPTLERFLNWNREPSIYHYEKTWAIYYGVSRKATWISSNFIRRICYSLNWIEVKEIDFETFFKKAMLVNNITEIEVEFIKKNWLLEKNIWTILVPECLFINNDLYIFK